MVKMRVPRNLTIMVGFFTVMAVLDAYVGYMSNFEMVNVMLLAIMCTLSAVGLFLLKRWAYYLALATCVLHEGLVIPTLYTSFVIFGSSAFNAALVVWAVLLVVAIPHLVKVKDLLK
jgi:uncharacterized membrane protein (DUF2068 family)